MAVHLIRFGLLAWLVCTWGSLFAQSADADLLLQKWLNLASQNHPSVLGKQAEKLGSEAGVSFARSQYWPTPSVLTERAANQTHKSPTPSFFANSSWGASSNTTLRLQQPLWAGGRIDAALDVAQVRDRIVGAGLRETQQALALRTLEAWQALLLGWAKQQAAQQYLLALDHLAAMMQRRVDAQVSAALDAQLVQSRRLAALADLGSARTAVLSAVLRLEQWTGETIHIAAHATALDQALQLEAKVQPEQGATQMLPFTPALGLSEDMDWDNKIGAMPSVQRAQMELELAQAEIKQRKAEIWPSLYARLDRQFGSGESSFSKTSETIFYVGLQQSLGAGLSVKAQIDLAAARLDSIGHELQALRREWRERLQNEWREWQSLRERAEQTKALQVTQAALMDAYTRLFVAGRRSWLELLNTQRELNSAQQQQLELKALLHASGYRLRIYTQALQLEQQGGPSPALSGSSPIYSSPTIQGKSSKP